MKSLLLDTNSYSEFVRGSHTVLDAITVFDYIYMSVIVIGELYDGFLGGSNFNRNVALLNIFLGKRKVRILGISEDTAKVFGRIKQELKKKGSQIPINDVWIAAQAIEKNATLLSFDKHFTKVSDLKLQS